MIQTSANIASSFRAAFDFFLTADPELVLTEGVVLFSFTDRTAAFHSVVLLAFKSLELIIRGRQILTRI